MTHTLWEISKEGNIIQAGKNGGNCLIAKISKPSTPEKKANAKLMASAPALLEALRNLENAVMATIINYPDSKRELLDVQIKAIEAINLAEGK